VSDKTITVQPIVQITENMTAQELLDTYDNLNVLIVGPQGKGHEIFTIHMQAIRREIMQRLESADL